MRRALRGLCALALAFASATLASCAAGASPSTPAACPSGQPGFSYTFWNPYDDWSLAQVDQDLGWQSQVDDDGIIVDWSVDQEADAAWYPDQVGYGYFESTIPTLVAATAAAGQPLWMGLIVSPTLFQQDANSWSFLEAEVPRFEAVADDLYRQYGSTITGWYIPTEPNQTNVATPALSLQYGTWLSQIDAYLHTYDGDKQVMIAAEMPSAALTGLTPHQFVQEMQPMMSVAHINVWDFEDGFGMTGWTPQQEARGFSLAIHYGDQDGDAVWADVYTPASSTPLQWEAYLHAIAGAGTSVFSQWTFNDYMDPSNITSNVVSAVDFIDYFIYCVLS